MDPENHSTAARSLVQVLGSTLCLELSAVAQVSGQTRWSGTTPCQQPPSDSCCCLTNLRTWEKSTKSQADRWDMTGQECLHWLHVELAVFLNGLSDERCNCRSQTNKLPGVKNGFYCCPMTELIALPIEVYCVYVFVDYVLLQFSSIKRRNIRVGVFFGMMLHRSKCRNHDTQN